MIITENYEELLLGKAIARMPQISKPEHVCGFRESGGIYIGVLKVIAQYDRPHEIEMDLELTIYDITGRKKKVAFKETTQVFPKEDI